MAVYLYIGARFSKITSLKCNDFGTKSRKFILQ